MLSIAAYINACKSLHPLMFCSWFFGLAKAKLFHISFFPLAILFPFPSYSPSKNIKSPVMCNLLDKFSSSLTHCLVFVVSGDLVSFHHSSLLVCHLPSSPSPTSSSYPQFQMLFFCHPACHPRPPSCPSSIYLPFFCFLSSPAAAFPHLSLSFISLSLSPVRHSTVRRQKTEKGRLWWYVCPFPHHSSLFKFFQKR